MAGQPFPDVLLTVKVTYANKAGKQALAEDARSGKDAHAFSTVLAQPVQLQLLQYMPAAKQSQYSFRHLDFLQWQCFGALQQQQGEIFSSVAWQRLAATWAQTAGMSSRSARLATAGQ